MDTVLVDEAAQAIEAETLIPLCLAPRQLVLIGDPMQLSATVCQSDAAKRAHFCRSMMERMMSNCQDVIMLQEQYRMHPEISRFPSGRFYGGRLINAQPGESTSIAGNLAGLPPYAVIDIAKGEEVVAHRRGHVSNPKEARAVARAAAWVSARTNGSVVVITFYSGQVASIRRFLDKARSRGMAAPVEVHTVDSFQGSEADVVLLSFVRANQKRRLGFLTEFRRLNVALTRARRALLVFANVARLAAPGLEARDDVAALFADAAARGHVRSGLRALLGAGPGPGEKEARVLRRRLAKSLAAALPGGSGAPALPPQVCRLRRSHRGAAAPGAAEVVRRPRAAAGGRGGRGSRGKGRGSGLGTGATDGATAAGRGRPRAASCPRRAVSRRVEALREGQP